MKTIGIDEVGRGPIAGPVAVAAFTYTGKIEHPDGIPLRDSKKLTPIQRELWFDYLEKNSNCTFFVSMVGPSVIDSKGIVYAIKQALSRSLAKIQAQEDHMILLDGGLRAPEKFTNQKTIVKGDEKEKVIALASIVAKVTRDRYMKTQAGKYKGYGFDLHMGYGTRGHYNMINTHGLCDLHRKSFIH